MKYAEETLRDSGALGGYCGCGLMRMKHERGACHRCGSTVRTSEKPAQANQIRAIGHTRFTQFTTGNEL
jgi:hypothetical protein